MCVLYDYDYCVVNFDNRTKREKEHSFLFYILVFVRWERPEINCVCALFLSIDTPILHFHTQNSLNVLTKLFSLVFYK